MNQELRLRGVAVSPGIVFGKAYVRRPDEIVVPNFVVDAGKVEAEIERLRAGLAAMRGDLALAESLNQESQARYGPKADHVAIAGWIAFRRGDEERARELALLCLRYEPQHPTGRALLDALRRRAEARAANSGEGERPVAGAG